LSSLHGSCTVADLSGVIHDVVGVVGMIHTPGFDHEIVALLIFKILVVFLENLFFSNPL
jgi:hypothetical protein